MALGKTHRILIQLLKVCEVEEEGAIAIMLLVKEEKLAEQLIQWIDENPMAVESEILEKAIRLNTGRENP
ncbi:MAG: hypothetical protein PUD55_03020 [Firmicutes bacterium]|nr:hypothetical protein [Bacillota bacterium]